MVFLWFSYGFTRGYPFQPPLPKTVPDAAISSHQPSDLVNQLFPFGLEPRPEGKNTTGDSPRILEISKWENDGLMGFNGI